MPPMWRIDRAKGGLAQPSPAHQVPIRTILILTRRCCVARRERRERWCHPTAFQPTTEKTNSRSRKQLSRNKTNKKFTSHKFGQKVWPYFSDKRSDRLSPLCCCHKNGRIKTKSGQNITEHTGLLTWWWFTATRPTLLHTSNCESVQIKNHKLVEIWKSQVKTNQLL